ncbi:DUF1294 domain-containing protein [Arenicella xantha]|uniref:Uncharacterized membrane protein YsdA (DUF1294 family) n=1 Tax=Arenicella xantha TaxID=644221 RepID=A0A395JJN3_9GAMM|nr:DUF1294 domain-containing protein [Arenicella xantha]RBP48884.1 uncharacterized membrane protein YsdA (DUF1294 family) [Arenicella xantha]
MHDTGMIIRWNADKGYGFIQAAGGGTQVFAHISSFTHKPVSPAIGDVVKYRLGKDRQGRVCAKKIQYANRTEVTSKKSKRTAKPTSGSFKYGVWIWLVLGYFTAVIGANLLGRLPTPVLLWIVLLSVISLLFYWSDKRAAEQGHWRTTERSLHVLSLLGGWPGALLAQKIIRHKSSKKSFQWVFWLTVLVNVGAVVWILTASGNAVVKQLITQLSRVLF